MFYETFMGVETLNHPRWCMPKTGPIGVKFVKSCALC